MIKRTLYEHLVLALCVLIWVGCEDGFSIQKERVNIDSNHKSIAIPNNLKDPIEHAAKILGLNIADIARPEIIQDGYHMVARLPLIDKFKQSPFVLYKWADEVSNEILAHSDAGVNKTLISILKTIINDDYYYEIDQRNIANYNNETLIDTYRLVCEKFGQEINPASEKAIINSPLSQKFMSNLNRLFLDCSNASLLTQSAFISLNEEELSFLGNRPERFFFPHNYQFDFMTGPTDIQYKILTISRKIDFNKLFSAAIIVSAAIDRFSAYLTTTEENFAEDFFETPSEKDLLLYLPTPIGNIVVLGPGDDEFNGVGAIVIDLGGNDKYFGQISTGHLTPGRIGIAIDREGNDIYNPQTDRYGLGFGCLSIGMQIDLSGDDVYISGDLAQGTGIYGVGLLIDHDGNDHYHMNIMGQGMGLFGLGGVIDQAGNDRYLINSLGQGVGSTMGLGLLCDRKGNDRYLSKEDETRGRLKAHVQWSHVQGVGLSMRSHKWRIFPSFYGGIGILNDGAGNDFYFAEKGNCMGSSYFRSVGVLVDHDGDDKYMPQGGYGISSAVHWTASAFIDKAGNDLYLGAIQTGGVASDRSVAIMVDRNGDDVYGPTPEYLAAFIKKEYADKGAPLDDKSLSRLVDEKLSDVSYGTAKKPNAIGILIDYNGDDRYYARDSGWGESCGGVMPPKEPRHWGHGLLLDLNGSDFYSKSGRKNNHYHLYYSHGISYDTVYSKPLVIDQDKSVFHTHGNIATRSEEKSENTTKQSSLIQLDELNYFERFKKYGELINSGEAAITKIVEFLLESKYLELNRDLTEVLAEIGLRTDLLSYITEQVESLLVAEDPYVRLFSARLLGWWSHAGSQVELLNALKSTDTVDRSDLIWAVGRVSQSNSSVDTLKEYALNDSYQPNRLQAVLALANYIERNKTLNDVESETIMETLLSLVGDDNIVISAYAVKGLEYFGDDLRVIETLFQKLSSADIYIRRFSANALIRNGKKEAIPILMQSLRFPSIDTFEHYDNDLAKLLAFYCGTDFPPDLRYKSKTWLEWWKKNGTNVDLNKNLKIMKDIENAFLKQNVGEGLQIFENLLVSNPDNNVIKKRYLVFCNHWITYNYLTLPNISQDVLEKCILLQKKMVQLDPENKEYTKRLLFFENWVKEYF